MKDYKEFLFRKLQVFFETVENSLTNLIGYRDSRRGKVIRIDDMNLYDINDEDFDKNPDFFDGYAFVSRRNNSIELIQKLNLTKIADAIKLTLDETKEEIKDFLNKNLYLLDKKIGGEDFRGYYKLNRIISETIQTKGDVYLVLRVLLDLVESIASKERNDEENINPEQIEPSEEEIRSIEKEFSI